jgi:hypothetical protein
MTSIILRNNAVIWGSEAPNTLADADFLYPPLDADRYSPAREHHNNEGSRVAVYAAFSSRISVL